MNLTKSYYKGAIQNSGIVKLTLDADSIVVLTGDSYVTSLSNAVSDNSNIYANGYKLYVNGSEVSINQGTAPESFLSDSTETEVAETQTVQDASSDTSNSINMPILISCIVGGILIIVAIITAIILSKRRKRLQRKETETPKYPGNI